MGNTQQSAEAVTTTEDKETKMLGAHVDPETYWKFKEAAAVRNEDLKVAIKHAAWLYIEVVKEGGEGG